MIKNLLASPDFRTKVADRIADEVDGSSFDIADKAHGRMEGLSSCTEISQDEIEFEIPTDEGDGNWTIEFRANGSTLLSSLSPDGDDVSHSVEGSASGALSVKVAPGSEGNSLSSPCVPVAEITELNCSSVDFDMTPPESEPPE